MWPSSDIVKRYLSCQVRHHQETAHVQTKKDETCLHDPVVAGDDLDAITINLTPTTIATLKAADEKEPEDHEERTYKKYIVPTHRAESYE